VDRGRLRRIRAWGYAIAAFLGVCLLLALYFRPPTLEQVAMRGLAAVERRDSRLLLRNLTRSEVDALKLNDRNLSRFLDTFVGPRMQGFVRAGKPEIMPFPDSGQLLAIQEYVHPDGRRMGIDVNAAATPEGPKITYGIASLTLSVLSANVPPGQRLPGGRARAAFWGRSLREALPILSSTGINGLVRQGKSGRDEFFTFEQCAERSERQGRGEPVSDIPGG
jgi:hypothetical protein